MCNLLPEVYEILSDKFFFIWKLFFLLKIPWTRIGKFTFHQKQIRQKKINLMSWPYCISKQKWIIKWFKNQSRSISSKIHQTSILMEKICSVASLKHQIVDLDCMMMHCLERHPVCTDCVSLVLHKLCITSIYGLKFLHVSWKVNFVLCF